MSQIIKRSHLPTRNRILAALPREEYERLLPRMELVRLAKSRIVYNAGDVMRYAYFLLDGMVSVLSSTESGATIEVGMVGNEGMVGVPVILRVPTTPYRLMVQIRGEAMRIGGGDLQREFNRGGRLQDLLLRYTHTLLTQISQSAVCNRFHTTEQRLCRWLLVGRDRVESDTLYFTQEILSHMLGAPRTRVTMAAGNIKKERLIDYSRGKITILDRRGLEFASCECYRVVTEGIKPLAAA